MSNLERIQENNIDLAECLELANSLPDASGTGSNDAFIRLYEDGVLTDNEVTSLPNNFCRGWYHIKGLDFPNVVIAGSYLCYNCTNLEWADMPKCTSLDSYAFYNCANMTYANFPKLETLGTHAFRGCSSLTNMVLSSCTRLNNTSFQAASALESIDLPVANYLGNGVFLNCTALSTVIIRSDKVCSLNNVSSFQGTPIESGTGYIYVPSSLVASYKSASNWSNYANQFRAEEDYPEITGG